MNVRRQACAAFAVATVLVFIALVTIAIKTWVEGRFDKQEQGESL